MLKKDITYNDLDDNPITETFWFNLNKAELAKMALSKEGKEGGFESWVKRIQASNDGEVIIENFEKILLATIGERSADNKRFVKSDEIRDNFRYSDAYSVLFMEMVTDAEKMAAFVNGIVPAALRNEVAAETAKQIGSAPAEAAAPQATTAPAQSPTVVAPEPPKDNRPEWMKDPNRIPTQAELRGATVEQMQEAFRRQSAGAGPVTQEQIPLP